MRHATRENAERAATAEEEDVDREVAIECYKGCVSRCSDCRSGGRGPKVVATTLREFDRDLYMTTCMTRTHTHTCMPTRTQKRRKPTKINK